MKGNYSVPSPLYVATCPVHFQALTPYIDAIVIVDFSVR